MIMSHVPFIDIAPFLHGSAADRQRVARQVDEACREVGFFMIGGHGVPERLMEDTRAAFKAFFDQPADYKRRFGKTEDFNSPGFVEVGDAALSYTRGAVAPPDLNEIFQVTPVDVGDSPYFTAPQARQFFPTNRFPDVPADFSDLAVEYYRAVYGLARSALSIAAVALRLPEDYFEGRVDKAMATLVVRDYPEQKVVPLPGQLRAGAHTDFGTLTLLLAEDRPGGLEVMSKRGTWEPVVAPHNCYIVNLGDMMARWTNDKWVSTLHRVANPPRDASGVTRRTSLVFFTNPNYDTLIECLPTCMAENGTPKYPPVLAGDYYLGKMRQMRKKVAEPAA